MLALLGFITIVLLLTAILTKKMSPLVALIAIPIAAALIGGFGMQTSKFIVAGVTSIAPVAGMFVFAILFLVSLPTLACSIPSSRASCALSAAVPAASCRARPCWCC